MKETSWKDLIKQTEKRNKKILAEYKQGKKTMTEIGEAYGISRARVSFIIKAELKKLKDATVNTIDKR